MVDSNKQATNTQKAAWAIFMHLNVCPAAGTVKRKRAATRIMQLNVELYPAFLFDIETVRARYSGWPSE